MERGCGGAAGGAAGREDGELEMLLREYFEKEEAEADFHRRGGPVADGMVRWREYGAQRGALIEWVVDVCEHCRLSLTTANLAVVLCDRVLLRTSVPEISLQLVAGACVAIAAKFEEAEQAVPTFSRIRAMTHSLFSVTLFKKMEIAVLTELGWKLSVPTASHFLDAFLVRAGGGLVAGDALEGPASFAAGLAPDAAWQPTAATRRRLAHLIVLMHNISISCFDFFAAHKPSAMAASILLCSRMALGVRAAWPARLEEVTGYSADGLHPCAAAIWREYGRYVDEVEAPSAEESGTGGRAAGAAGAKEGAGESAGAPGSRSSSPVTPLPEQPPAHDRGPARVVVGGGGFPAQR